MYILLALLVVLTFISLLLGIQFVKEEVGFPFLFAGAIGVIGLVAVANFNPYAPLLTECEKKLPRDQKCIMVAVPEEKENG